MDLDNAVIVDVEPTVPIRQAETLAARRIEGLSEPILARYSACLAANGVEVAGIEFIRDAEGEIYT